MAVKQIVNVKDPNLRQGAKPVSQADKKLIKLIEDMIDTLKAQNDPEGVGLAAPQIGVPLQVFIMRDKKKILPVVNPQILSFSKKNNDPKKEEKEKGYVMEGCLSLPHYYGPVKRAWEVKLKYQIPKLENGEWKLKNIENTFTGFPAQIVQHEVDHLNGKVFIDRLFEQDRILYVLKNNEWKEVEI
ncbi:MAG: peptide deformylase [Candidatus Blackburnbacteria bacterium RIFCSPHIGHO2_01_FULL_40_17]|uniref:Peptide deformylase n=1 Tax=Candidatus Blackburnbacteria bacterium RIFCSPLOWO2_01_FULL_40_20 TaxID=1797519 RepID=A0A1G1VB37_9BACT|nr:MAG: Peptide deformylase [Microgenomates group bacterium GW2011_GWA2_39_19]OGY07128.1 MAG: peptide deformylase [Candidatus Blackburnbacteria bacterium RIFCSPHIGHO2_01_FULL_40_17]OGY12704.1 MAG: peptide deformylase [Candidatus Blackburnbacteria bacterium RIFCSPLOWO2_01_FULL_40_20]OGY15188.1 MAG: peptide deformylase [Candidatus Blackburnbacteria bacterium RIFCSPLOWO2_02_FULL_40_10]HBL52355.1 peptide deformylase [Candidatus Blackburnbacteria bacterium]